MLIKQLCVCQECGEIKKEEIVEFDLFKFKKMIDRDPDHYSYEDGPGYQGIWVDVSQPCIECR